MFISINLSLFIFLSFRTLKDSRTLLFTWKDLLKKVQLTGVLDSVTQVKTINSSWLQMLNVKNQTSIQKLFGDHATGWSLLRKQDLIPLSKTLILKYLPMFLSQELQDSKLVLELRVFTIMDLTSLIWPLLETLFTLQETTLLVFNWITIIPTILSNLKLVSKTNKTITPGNSLLTAVVLLEHFFNGNYIDAAKLTSTPLLI